MDPSQFSGAPFAADPQSGWSYLPAMGLFTAVPLAVAVPLFIVFHLALAGFGIYALARLLKIPPLGALAAGAAYMLSVPFSVVRFVARRRCRSALGCRCCWLGGNWRCGSRSCAGAFRASYWRRWR